MTIEMRQPKYSINRKLKVAIFSIVTFFLIQFLGGFLSSQRLLSGLTAIHRQQQMSGSVLRLHQLSDTLADIPGERIGSTVDAKRFFASVFAQAQVKLAEAKSLSASADERVYLDQITEGLTQLRLSAERYFNKMYSKQARDTDRDLFLFRQFSSDVAEGEEKLRLLMEKESDQLFGSVYKIRYRPYVVTISLTSLFILLALLVGISFKNKISASIANLLRATQEVASGNLGLRAPVLVLDEIGMLTDAFNAMTRELEQSTVSRNYVEAVMQSLPDSLFVLSLDGRIEQVNRTAGNVYGSSSESLKGKYLTSLLSHGVPEFVSELRDAQTVFISRTGRSIPVSLSTSRIRGESSKTQSIVCVMKDLSERKEIEEEKRIIAENQIALADASSILSESIDFDLTLKNIVRAIVPHLGDRCFVHSSDKTGLLKKADGTSFEANPSILKAFESRKSTWVSPSVDQSNQIPGHPDILSYFVCPLYLRARAFGTITVGFTQQQTMGSRDSALIDEIGRRAAISLENSRLYHEAQEAILSRDEFLSIASHELKTPLTSLSLQLQILNRQIARAQKENPEQQAVLIPVRTLKIVASSETQSNKLAALLDELLDLTRIRIGKLQLAKEDVDLSSVVKGVVDRFRVEASLKNILITTEVENSIMGHWDPMRIEQVVSNLVSNAVKYGNGSAILIKAFQQHGMARLIVEDRGMGIPRDMIDKIFERFERAGISGRKISGLGLGLYICRQIIEAHGGSVRVDSELGRGSSFIVDFPLSGASGTKLVS